MKKIISLGLFLLFCLTLASCVLQQSTTLEFVEYPNSTYVLDASASDEQILDKVTVRIDGGETIKLSKAIKDYGVTVTGIDFKTTGTKTLAIIYKSLVITYQYVVFDGSTPDVQEVDTDWAGNGTLGNEYIISSVEELLGLAKMVNTPNEESKYLNTYSDKYFKLSTDLDLEGVVWTPIGEGTRKYMKSTNSSKPDYQGEDLEPCFKGNFNGNGKTISNLSDLGYVPTSSNYNTSAGELVEKGYAFGLFGRVSGSLIENINLENVKIKGISSIIFDSTGNKKYVVYNGDSVAAVVGYSCGDGLTIQNCNVISGEIYGCDSIAGIVGRAYGGPTIINNCSANVEVTAVKNGNDQGKAAIILGSFSTGSNAATDTSLTITDCNSRGSVLCTGFACAGGIVGYLGRIEKLVKIEDCENYATFEIQTEYYNGAVCKTGVNAYVDGQKEMMMGGIVGLFGGQIPTSEFPTSKFITCTTSNNYLFGDDEQTADYGVYDANGTKISNAKLSENIRNGVFE